MAQPPADVPAQSLHGQVSISLPINPTPRSLAPVVSSVLPMAIDATATADHSDTSVPVQTTPAMLSAFCDDSSLPPLFKCPFAICSQHKGWRCLDPLLRHIETKHLPISTDLPNGFLTSACRWICPKCRVFIPLFRVCRLCHCCNPAQTDLAHIPDEV